MSIYDLIERVFGRGGEILDACGNCGRLMPEPGNVAAYLWRCPCGRLWEWTAADDWRPYVSPWPET